MRGTVAKRCRKILFALQVKGRVPTTTEYKRCRGQLLALGARVAYQDMKLAHREHGGFVTEPPKVLPKKAQGEYRRKKARDSKRRARERRRRPLGLLRATWQCPCDYMNIGPICTKCGAPKI